MTPAMKSLPIDRPAMDPDDDEGGAGWDQRAQRAPGEERPQAESSVVPLAVEFRHGHFADHDDGRRTRAQGRREHALADDTRRDQTASHPGKPVAGCLEHAVTHPRRRNDRSQQHEQGQRRPRKVEGRAEGRRAGFLKRRKAVTKQCPNDPGDTQREHDGHPDHHQHEQRRYDDATDNCWVQPHSISFLDLFGYYSWILVSSRIVPLARCITAVYASCEMSVRNSQAIAYRYQELHGPQRFLPSRLTGLTHLKGIAGICPSSSR